MIYVVSNYTNIQLFSKIPNFKKDLGKRLFNTNNGHIFGDDGVVNAYWHRFNKILAKYGQVDGLIEFYSNQQVLNIQTFDEKFEIKYHQVNIETPTIFVAKIIAMYEDSQNTL